MKKLVLLALATVVVLGAGVLAVRHYKNYQNKQTQVAQAVESAEVARVKAAAEAEKAELVKQYDRVRVECEKGRAAYDSLTAFSKSKMAVPQCGPAVIQ